MVGAIGNVDFARFGVNGDSVRAVELRLRRRTADTRGTRFTRSRDQSDLLGRWIIADNSMVFGIGNEHGAIAVQAKVFRTIENCLPGVAQGIAALAIACYGANGAIR